MALSDTDLKRLIVLLLADGQSWAASELVEALGDLEHPVGLTPVRQAVWDLLEKGSIDFAKDRQYVSTAEPKDNQVAQKKIEAVLSSFRSLSPAVLFEMKNHKLDREAAWAATEQLLHQGKLTKKVVVEIV